MASAQVAITTDLSGEAGSIFVWDVLTGTTLVTYKGGGVIRQHGLSFISDQFIISAQKDTQILNVWAFQQKDQIHTKIICPGKVNSLAVTPDSTYCVVSIAEKIYIWQLSSGCLVNILERHYQPVTCLKISSDGAYIVSGGEDGLILIWFLPEIISGGSNTDEESIHDNPKHSLTHHTSAITDIHINFGVSLYAKACTCSLDRTCKIYELITGRLLLSIMFDSPLHSITMDPADYFLFVGAENGNIYEVKMFTNPQELELSKTDFEPTYKGHENKVTCLAISIDGLALISGSQDNSIKVWQIISKQCMRTLRYKGPIGNITVVPTPSNLISGKSKSNFIPIPQFKRNLFNRETDSMELVAKMSRTNESVKCSQNTGEMDVPVEDQSENLKEEIQNLKRINNDLYNFTLNSIFNKVENDI